MRTIVTILMLLPVLADAQVWIHRVLVDPDGNESRNDTPEIIEIRNYGTGAMNLAEWTLQSTPPAETPDLWTLPSLLLAPGATAIIYHNAVRGSSWKWMDDPPGVPRLPRESRDARLAQSFEDGRTTYEAAQELGVSQGTAWRAIDRLVPKRHGRRRERERGNDSGNAEGGARQ